MSRFVLSLCLLLLSVGFAACNAGSPQAQAAKTGADFSRACKAGNFEEALTFALHPDETIMPCPVGLYKIDGPADITAEHPMARVVYADGRWAVDPGNMLDPSSPRMVFVQLKYVIAAQDVEKLAQIVKNPQSEEVLRTWLQSSQANDVYAALAMTTNPWFVIDKNAAICESAGRSFRFEFVDNAWKWVMPVDEFTP